jgi:hypothetical protein
MARIIEGNDLGQSHVAKVGAFRVRAPFDVEPKIDSWPAVGKFERADDVGDRAAPYGLDSSAMAEDFP